MTTAETVAEEEDTVDAAARAETQLRRALFRATGADATSNPINRNSSDFSTENRPQKTTKQPESMRADFDALLHAATVSADQESDAPHPNEIKRNHGDKKNLQICGRQLALLWSAVLATQERARDDDDAMAAAEMAAMAESVLDFQHQTLARFYARLSNFRGNSDGCDVLLASLEWVHARLVSSYINGDQHVFH